MVSHCASSGSRWGDMICALTWAAVRPSAIAATAMAATTDLVTDRKVHRSWSRSMTSPPSEISIFEFADGGDSKHSQMAVLFFDRHVFAGNEGVGVEPVARVI